MFYFGGTTSMFIKWYQLPNVVDQRLPPHMSWITNPPLVCYGERIHPWYAKDHESTPGMPRITNLLFCGETVGFGKKISLGQNHRKKSGSRKTWRMGIKKKTFKNPRKIKFFFWPQHSPGFRWSRHFSMKLEKNKKWKPRVFYGDRLYAEENDAMLRRTIPPLVCSGARIHPWYATDHESTPGMLTNPPLVC